MFSRPGLIITWATGKHISKHFNFSSVIQIEIDAWLLQHHRWTQTNSGWFHWYFKYLLWLYPGLPSFFPPGEVAWFHSPVEPVSSRRMNAPLMSQPCIQDQQQKHQRPQVYSGETSCYLNIPGYSNKQNLVGKPEKAICVYPRWPHLRSLSETLKRTLNMPEKLNSSSTYNSGDTVIQIAEKHGSFWKSCELPFSVKIF